jgi:hypothetical protein
VLEDSALFPDLTETEFNFNGAIPIQHYAAGREGFDRVRGLN